MSISTKLKEFIDQEGAAYQHHVHATAYTSQEIAAASHVPGREMVKSVMLRTDNTLVMAVLSANSAVNLDLLRQKMGCETLRLATEEEFRDAFPTCEVGAMPPFGNIFNMPTYCESTLNRNQEIEFNAGTHFDTIRMAFADFERLAQPRLVHFAEPFRGHPQRLAG